MTRAHVSRLKSCGLKFMPVYCCICCAPPPDCAWQGVIPKYGDMLDEMTTGTCVALEVLTTIGLIPCPLHLRE